MEVAEPGALAAAARAATIFFGVPPLTLFD